MPNSGLRRPLPHLIPNKTIGKCIYCGATGDLTEEHVIPLGLHGVLKLDKASCRDCAAITSAFEGRVLSKMYGRARHVLNMRTRRKKKREQQATYPMLFKKHGRTVKKDVSVEDCIAVIPAPLFGLPEYFAEPLRAQGIVVPTGFITAGAVAFQRPNATPPSELVRRQRAKKPSVQVSFDWKDFARLLAKIAYGFTVAKYGLDNIEQKYVIDAILGRSDDVLRWVGCQSARQLPTNLRTDPAKDTAIYHRVGIDLQQGDFVVWVRLFDNFDNSPEYIVIVGKPREELRGLLFGVGYNLV
jgi:hypothetical protein